MIEIHELLLQLFSEVNSIQDKNNELKLPSTMIIANAFEKHISENHNADFEVCKNPECELAYALEIGESVVE
jgi:hypothetical protein